MRTIGIVGGNESEMERAFLRFPGDINFVNGSALQNETALDALIAQDAKPALAEALNKLGEGAYLIINTDKKEIFPFLEKMRGNFRLITYGFNNKACVTASSTMDGVLQACVQRGFITFDGQMTEPGEFDFPYETEADTALGLAAVYLLCSKQ